MKKGFLLIFTFLCISSLCYGQVKNADSASAGNTIKASDSGQSKKKHLIKIAPFISGGINSFNFNGINLADSMAVHSGATNPTGLTFSAGQVVPAMGLGIELADKKRLITNDFSVGYKRFTGQYSFTTVSSFVGGSEEIITTDMGNGNYTCNIFSVGSSLRVNASYFFFLVGFNADLNYLSFTEQDNETIKYYDLEFFKHWSVNQSKTSSGKLFYLSVPLQFGIGCNIKIKRFELTPGAYYNICLRKGYSYYGFALDVLLLPKSK